MGGCVGTGRRSHDHEGRRRHGGFPSDISSSLSLNGHHNGGGGNGPPIGGYSSSSSNGAPTSIAKNRPLRAERIKWKSDIPITDGQLRSKRDEFWDTAPAFEGKTEIWNALRAAAEALGTGGSDPEDENNRDFELAQAILDGAGISIPNGSLSECYDELGTRYVIPVYCLSYPINIVYDKDKHSSSTSGSSSRADSPAHHSEPVGGSSGKSKKPKAQGVDMKLRIRISITGSDVKLIVNSESSVRSCKQKLQEQEKLKEAPNRQRWYFGGKILPDKTKIGAHGIPSGYVVQCVLNQLDFDVIQTAPNTKD